MSSPIAKHLLITSCTIALLSGALFPFGVQAFRVDNFVRSANQFLVAGPDLKDSDWPSLSRFDLIVLPAEAQNFNPTVAQELRLRNPDIIILAYVPTVSYNDRYWNDALHLKLKNRLTPQMELHNRYGEQVSIWPETRAYNVANSVYRDVYIDYVTNEVYASGYWDGIFLDEVSSSISWVGTTDVDQNGFQDDSRLADRSWNEGNAALFRSLRERLGDDAILITNGSSESSYQPFVNGRMFETFPTPWEGQGRWQDSMRLLLRNARENKNPDVFVVNSNTLNSGQISYANFRFGLTSAMLGDAFFGYDFGELSHGQLWIFDEYEAFLGRAVDVPKDELRERASLLTSEIYPSVWSREFQEGRVVVNATSEPQTIELLEDFERVNGTQDRSVNDGRISDVVTLNPQDGVVLLRPMEDLLHSAFANGSFVRLYTLNGHRNRSGFFAYTGATLGGDTVVRADLNHDGFDEIVTANRSQVRIHSDSGQLQHLFYPYSEAYKSGINLAVGDLNRDGTMEIVTGTKDGGGAHVRIFNHEGVLIHPGFFAFDKAFRGGVNVAVGDVTGDGFLEIVAGAGVGGGPHVRIFNRDGVLIHPGFFAFDKAFRGGVNVAAGDVTGDGVADIITGPGKGGTATVRVFSQSGAVLVSEFEAFTSRQRNGVSVAAEDLNGDGIAELMALTTDVFTLSGN
ncbi:hypothetical protein A3C17_00325 [Candidatus Uhrbacteria bacterium RIFCSPHIGHO2_02_FULL_53_13]|uniref:Uncharacterized protein n=2 Tax=Candidatus Uhriibacteriota TaxID=1752732 RepID=A0A1F7U095_9BACT|nr:MAG: hypothetical protein A3C17_00325 [Candidatus Uhrbacteria bacterium RIFCSPHIGHO2_02_FULL_53_13]OGL89633.1 MAG: hypothetical protein A3I45_04760 [Candidatus Uhrbacteria bacterium RIFCSPLOWO2_02_FULL_53_10]